MLLHERLDVYRVAADFDAVVFELTRARWEPDRNQLLRASAGVLNNIAEGAAERAPREKARIFRIALREASECDATLTRMHRRVPLSAPRYNEARSHLARVIRMLDKLVDRMESRQASGS